MSLVLAMQGELMRVTFNVLRAPDGSKQNVEVSCAMPGLNRKLLGKPDESGEDRRKRLLVAIDRLRILALFCEALSQ